MVILHIGRLTAIDLAIDLSFSTLEFIWKFSWQTLSEPHGSNHNPIVIITNSNHPMHPSSVFSYQNSILYNTDTR